MSSFSTIKKVIIVIVVIALGGGIFFVVKGSGGEATPALLRASSESQADNLLGRELLTVLAQLKSVQLDETFFNSDVFNNLHNFGQDIPKQEVGRNNPFAAVGTFSAPRSAETTSLEGR
jgi:hypothetical protein